LMRFASIRSAGTASQAGIEAASIFSCGGRQGGGGDAAMRGDTALGGAGGEGCAQPTSVRAKMVTKVLCHRSMGRPPPVRDPMKQGLDRDPPGRASERASTFLLPTWHPRRSYTDESAVVAAGGLPAPRLKTSAPPEPLAEEAFQPDRRPRDSRVNPSPCRRHASRREADAVNRSTVPTSVRRGQRRRRARIHGRVFRLRLVDVRQATGLKADATSPQV
jgi:hypothetical protein